MWDKLVSKFLFWRLKYIPERNFVYVLACFVGLLAGLAAITLKSGVHFVQELLTGDFQQEYANWLFIGYPLIGIVITVLLNLFFKDHTGHGITDIIYSISQKSGIIKQNKVYSRMITSAVTVGFGGSVGLEAPIAVTGSAIGSNLTRIFHLNQRVRNLMIACGAAGGVAAIFNAPVAGVIFAIEIILSNVTIGAFIPILMSSVTATLVAKFLLGESILFSFPTSDIIQPSDIPFYILLGLLAGLVSVYFSRTVMTVEGRIHQLKPTIRPLVGGILLGLIIFIFPPIYGEGYMGIKTLASDNSSAILYDSLFFNRLEDEWFLVAFCALMILAKPIASAITIGAGGSGGIFAPSLIVGGFLGFAFSGMVNQLSSGVQLSKNNFVLVGMCGVSSGVQYSPLTAIFLIAEITDGYTLFVPLMLVSAISYLTASYFEPNSLYTKRLIQRGELIKNDKDKHVLSLMRMGFLIEKDLLTINPDATLKDLVQLVSTSKRNIFPVVDEENKLRGIVTLDDIRKIMFDQQAQEDVHVDELMQSPPATVAPDEPMADVMQKFELTGAWNLPVIEDGKYLGFLSKSRIFNAYRSKIRQTQELH